MSTGSITCGTLGGAYHESASTDVFEVTLGTVPPASSGLLEIAIVQKPETGATGFFRAIVAVHRGSTNVFLSSQEDQLLALLGGTAVPSVTLSAAGVLGLEIEPGAATNWRWHMVATWKVLGDNGRDYIAA